MTEKCLVLSSLTDLPGMLVWAMAADDAGREAETGVSEREEVAERW